MKGRFHRRAGSALFIFCFCEGASAPSSSVLFLRFATGTCGSRACARGRCATEISARSFGSRCLGPPTDGPQGRPAARRCPVAQRREQHRGCSPGGASTNKKGPESFRYSGLYQFVRSQEEQGEAGEGEREREDPPPAKLGGCALSCRRAPRVRRCRGRWFRLRRPGEGPGCT